MLQRQFDLVSDHLVDELGVDVGHIPVTDDQSAVSGFAVGEPHLVWFGALTGIHPQLPPPPRIRRCDELCLRTGLSPRIGDGRRAAAMRSVFGRGCHVSSESVSGA